MTDLFSQGYEAYKIKNPIRLIELFAGIGSQAMALRDLGADFVNYKVVEFDKYEIAGYNAIHGTDFPAIDICGVHAEDLEIVETDKYEYIMTYSFPCQDLSVAGLCRGMEEGSLTRSSLLWQVKRILEEAFDRNGKSGLPQILLMENVVQVHSEQNREHFQKWLLFLESLGYRNWYEDIEASQYGVAQHRDRCFCVSILDGKDYSYSFPSPVPLDVCIRDYLEPQVDEKFYVKTEAAQRLIDDLRDRGELDSF